MSSEYNSNVIGFSNWNDGMISKSFRKEQVVDSVQNKKILPVFSHVIWISPLLHAVSNQHAIALYNKVCLIVLLLMLVCGMLDGTKLSR